MYCWVNAFILTAADCSGQGYKNIVGKYLLYTYVPTHVHEYKNIIYT